MSLDVSLIQDGVCVYDANITHNLNKMAEAAGIYEILWRPDELGFKNAKDIVSKLETGLIKLVLYKNDYEKYNPENGWGSREGLAKFGAEYLQACRDYPEAEIHVSR